MGHAHQHGSGGHGELLRASPCVRRAVLAGILLVAALTACGLARLWPDYGQVAQAVGSTHLLAPGTSYAQGVVLSVAPCAGPAPGATQRGGDERCQVLNVGLQSGPDSGQIVQVEARGALAAAGVRKGGAVELTAQRAVGDSSGDPQEPGGPSRPNSGATYSLSGVFRHVPLVVLALVFIAVVIFVGRLRGALALLALGLSAGVIVGFVLPAIVAGAPALPIGLVAASAIMLVTLFFVHGPNLRTASALIGTYAGMLIIAGVSWAAVHATHLSGLGDEVAGVLAGTTAQIDFRGLVSCSVLIAGLGVLNDVTITQASAVWELRSAAPRMGRRELYRSAMRIGRDHIASTVYTVFFAYVGAAISVLILLYLYNRPVLSLLTQEDIATEIVRTLVGSIGLVLAVPITTVVATALVPRPGDGDRVAVAADPA